MSTSGNFYGSVRGSDRKHVVSDEKYNVLDEKYPGPVERKGASHVRAANRLRRRGATHAVMRWTASDLKKMRAHITYRGWANEFPERKWSPSVLCAKMIVSHFEGRAQCAPDEVGKFRFIRLAHQASDMSPGEVWAVMRSFWDIAWDIGLE